MRSDEGITASGESVSSADKPLNMKPAYLSLDLCICGSWLSMKTASS
ncbi:MAG: hypothetical protein ACLUKN_02610 [Bacilli bacterium]